MRRKLADRECSFHLTTAPWSYDLHEWARDAAIASDAADFRGKVNFAEFDTGTKASDLMKALRCPTVDDLFDFLRRLQVKGIFNGSNFLININFFACIWAKIGIKISSQKMCNWRSFC